MKLEAEGWEDDERETATLNTIEIDELIRNFCILQNIIWRRSGGKIAIAEV